MIKIYHIKSYCNRPYVAYDGTQKLGTFSSIEKLREKYPNAKMGKAKSNKIKLELSSREIYLLWEVINFFQYAYNESTQYKDIYRFCKVLENRIRKMRTI